MSNENEDLSESLAATLTGSVGVTEDTTPDDVLPSGIADAVEDFDRHAAEKDTPVNNDMDDTREAAEQREAEQAQKRGRGQKVPLAALHEERTKRQQAELQLAAMQQQLQQFQAQQQVAQQQAQLAAEQAAIPDFDEDPRGYIEAKERQFAQALEQMQNGPAQQQQAAMQHQQVAAAVDNLEQQFMASVPDYEQAAALVQRDADAKIRQLYPQATEEQFQMIRTSALSEFARQALANGINPAAHLYQRAQELGFKPANRAPRKEPPTSLSNVHGSARAPDERSSVRVSDISEMSDAEFDKFWSGMKQSSAVAPSY